MCRFFVPSLLAMHCKPRLSQVFGLIAGLSNNEGVMQSLPLLFKNFTEAPKAWLLYFVSSGSYVQPPGSRVKIPVRNSPSCATQCHLKEQKVYSNRRKGNKGNSDCPASVHCVGGMFKGGD